MEQLTIDTGLREYAVNGGLEHGGGVLRFNPSDPMFTAVFAPCKISCKSWNSRCRRKAPLGTDAIQLLAQGGSARQGAAGGSIWPRQ